MDNAHKLFASRCNSIDIEQKDVEKEEEKNYMATKTF